MKTLHTSGVLAALLVMGLGTAEAAPVLFFGENMNPAEAVSGDPLTQRTAFLAALTAGVSTEDFSSVAGPSPLQEAAGALVLP
jgi:hypothetical protein